MFSAVPYAHGIDPSSASLKSAMPLQILGLNHNTAPVEIRERVVFSGDDVGRALQGVVALPGVREAVLEGAPFEVEGAYGGFGFEPPTELSDRVHFVLRG